METFEDRLNQILFQSPSGVRILSYDVLYEEIEVYSFNPRKGCEFHFMGQWILESGYGFQSPQGV